jgi:hypothetical protein
MALDLSRCRVGNQAISLELNLERGIWIHSIAHGNGRKVSFASGSLFEYFPAFFVSIGGMAGSGLRSSKATHDGQTHSRSMKAIPGCSPRALTSSPCAAAVKWMSLMRSCTAKSSMST